MSKTVAKKTTPADVIRDTLDAMTSECAYIGVLPDAATQAWAEEIVKQLNDWSMLTTEAQNRAYMDRKRRARQARPYSAH